MQSINFSLVMRTVFMTLPVIMIISVLSACAENNGFWNVTDDQGYQVMVNHRDTTNSSASDVTKETVATKNQVTPGPSATVHEQDGSTTTSISDADGESQKLASEKKDPVAAETPVSQPTTGDAMYATMDYGFLFHYPSEWDLKEESEGVVTLKTQKIVDETTEKSPEKVQVTFTHMPLPKEEKFYEWMSGLPQGDEKHLFNGKEYALLAIDTEGPFTRTYYRGLYNNGALKIELSYIPAYTIPLETDSADWKDYIQARKKYQQQVMEDFLKMISSIEEDA
ncbi:MAG: hypothetical protein AAB551_01620 [Patescibacteria group bacterium]